MAPAVRFPRPGCKAGRGPWTALPSVSTYRRAGWRQTTRAKGLLMPKWALWLHNLMMQDDASVPDNQDATSGTFKHALGDAALAVAFDFVEERICQKIERQGIKLGRRSRKKVRLQRNYYLAVVEESLGNDDQAIQLLEELTRQHPDNPSFNSRLGHLLLRNSRIESARITFERALTVDPDHLIASLGLARILAWERNWEAVFHSLQPVIEERPLFGPAVRLLARACRETARDCPSERSPEENTVESLVEDHLLEALADRSVLAFLRGNVGQGETIVQKRCSRCHSMERIQTGDKTSRQWLRTVRKMQTLAGHEWLSDQDAADILAYLSSRRP